MLSDLGIAIHGKAGQKNVRTRARTGLSGQNRQKEGSSTKLRKRGDRKKRGYDFMFAWRGARIQFPLQMIRSLLKSSMVWTI
jgi:hypothetical protein